MKNLIALISILIFTLSSFAQTAKVEGTKEDLKNNLAKNLVVFVMPSEITAENIDKSAQYYTDYFTVEYNNESKVANILLISEAETDRRVIMRFLLSTGVRIINFDGAEYTIMEFYSNFLE
jgi:sporulation protein YlmC with PRC-barrel domain